MVGLCGRCQEEDVVEWSPVWEAWLCGGCWAAIKRLLTAGAIVTAGYVSCLPHKAPVVGDKR